MFSNRPAGPVDLDENELKKRIKFIRRDMITNPGHDGIRTAVMMMATSMLQDLWDKEGTREQKEKEFKQELEAIDAAELKSASSKSTATTSAAISPKRF